MAVVTMNEQKTSHTSQMIVTDIEERENFSLKDTSDVENV